MKKSDYRRILIIQTAFIGDLILTTPLIRGLKILFPDADIDAVVRPGAAPVLKNNPHVNQVLLFDKKGNKWKSFSEMVQRLRHNSYEIAIIPHRSVTSGMLAFRSRIRERIGFKNRLSTLLLTKSICLTRSGSEIRRNLNLLKAFTDAEFSEETKLYPDILAQMRIQELLPEKNGKAFIAIAPGSVWYTKQWPEFRYAELAARLYRDGHQLIFLGSPGERKLCDRIIGEADAKDAINLAGITGITESATVTEVCDLMICNDSGAMHIANAVNTDVIAFFGPTVEQFGFSPYRANDSVFQVDLPCRPCGKHGGKTCPNKHFRCMLDIDIDAVYNEVNRKLFSKKPISPLSPTRTD